MPRLAAVTDKLTFIRSMSYTPNGLFNHTAAIYQMLTGYTADAVSPSGQLEPPTPKDFPTVGSNIVKFKPPEVPMLPFVMMPRPLQESNVINKGGTAGFLGRAYDPFYLFPPGDDLDNNKMDRVKVDALAMRNELTTPRMKRRARMLEALNDGMPALERAVARYDLDEYTEKALALVTSGRAREAFDLSREKDEPAIATEGRRSASAASSRDDSSRRARGSSKSTGPKSPTPTVTPGTCMSGFLSG